MIQNSLPLGSRGTDPQRTLSSLQVHPFLYQRAQARLGSRLAGTAGLITTLVFPAYLSAAQGLGPPGPLIVGRPLPWLAFQALAVIIVVSTVVTALRWWRRSRAIQRGEQIRLGLLVVGGIMFGVWAIYWGLLVP